MSIKIINKGAFLREQRKFPEQMQALTVEIDRAYVAISQKVNDRTIGFYTLGGSTLTGEKWQLSGKQYVGFRQAYQFVTADLPNIAHSLRTDALFTFTRFYGTFTDGTSSYPLPYVDTVAIGNQVSLSVDATNIVITVGGGAPPTVTRGIIVLEWITAT